MLARGRRCKALEPRRNMTEVQSIGDILHYKKNQKIDSK
jgi:hypothetical protein